MADTDLIDWLTACSKDTAQLKKKANATKREIILRKDKAYRMGPHLESQRKLIQDKLGNGQVYWRAARCEALKKEKPDEAERVKIIWGQLLLPLHPQSRDRERK
jgi:hypothetical protein